MRHVILCGVPLAGKTTLSNELLKTYHFINYTDRLKHIAVDMLAPYRHVTVEIMKRNKEHYRPFLQSIGDLVGFDTDPDYIEESLVTWKAMGKPPALFDNARTPSQVNYLKYMYDFSLVRLVIPPDVQAQRARKLGLAPEATARFTHWKEQGLPELVADLELDGTLPPSVLAEAIRNA